MRNILLLLFISVLFSCNNNSGSENNGEDTVLAEGDTLFEPQQRLPWITDYDTSKGTIFLKQQRGGYTGELTLTNMVADLNATWNQVQMEVKRTGNDTLYIKIPNSEFLTQRMGTSGATEWLATATYNLTELPGIRYVNYEFKEGDHLVPGTYSKADFKDLN